MAGTVRIHSGTEEPSPGREADSGKPENASPENASPENVSPESVRKEAKPAGHRLQAFTPPPFDTPEETPESLLIGLGKREARVVVSTPADTAPSVATLQEAQARGRQRVIVLAGLSLGVAAAAAIFLFGLKSQVQVVGASSTVAVPAASSVANVPVPVLSTEPSHAPQPVVSQQSPSETQTIPESSFRDSSVTSVPTTSGSKNTASGKLQPATRSSEGSSTAPTGRPPLVPDPPF